MSAKEMFETLGYELKLQNDSHILYSKPMEIGEIKILFKINIGEITKYSHISPDWEVEQILTLWFDEIKALNKQIEELGWLEDVKD